MHETLIANFHKAIKTKAAHPRPLPDKKFHKHDEYMSYGLKASEFRTIIEEFRPLFLELPLQERLDLALRLLQENIGELGHAGLYIITLSTKDLSPKHFPYLDSLPQHFHSWSHVDHLSLGVLQTLLLKHRKETLGLLNEWCLSPIRWKRRACIVTFVRKIAKSGEFTEEVLRFCEMLIRDEEDIVQKGVGWALKDNLRSAPERLFPYIKDLRQRGVSSTITLYAIRDLKGEKRREVLAVKMNTA